MSKKIAAVSKVELEIGGKTIPLTLEEAKELKAALEQLFPTAKEKEYVPVPYTLPARQITMPPYFVPYVAPQPVVIPYQPYSPYRWDGPLWGSRQTDNTLSLTCKSE